MVSVGSGAEALEKLADPRSSFAVALVDMTMPGLNGLETTRALRELDPGLQVILSSGYSTDLVDPAGIGDVAFLQKPYDLPRLLQMVGDAMGAAAESPRAA